jgi:hypothetical protein
MSKKSHGRNATTGAVAIIKTVSRADHGVNGPIDVDSLRYLLHQSLAGLGDKLNIGWDDLEDMKSMLQGLHELAKVIHQLERANSLKAKAS